MKNLNDDELCKWLRDNSSGTYRPSAQGADRIEQLKAEIELLKSKKFEAVVVTMKTSAGNDHYCRIKHPDTPDDASPWSDWWIDVHMSKYKGRMEYEAACLNKLFNLPESKDEYIDSTKFDGDNIDKV